MSRGRGAPGCPPPALRRGPTRLQLRRSSGLGGVLTRAPNLARIRLLPGVSASFPCHISGGNAATVVDLGAARCREHSLPPPPARPRRRKVDAAHASAESPCQVVDPSPGRRIWRFRDGFVVGAGWASMARRWWRRVSEEPVRVGEGAGEDDRRGRVLSQDAGWGSGFLSLCAAQRRGRGGRGHLTC
jgi:hypothetical protein